MKKLSLVALLAAVTFGGVEAADARMVAVPVATAPGATLQLGDPYLTHESEQNIEYYVAPGGAGSMVVASAPCATAATTCPCPTECPCTPVCCPAVRGLFDGGMCCGGRAVPPISICGC